MDVEFDPAKDAINIAKHGVSLAFGPLLWGDPSLFVVETTHVEDGEQRFRAIGFVGGRLWTAVHVYRDRNVRFISVRRSNDGEQRAYHSASGGSG